MRSIKLLSAFILAGAAPLAAQGKGRGNDGIPPGHRPPAGMCRIWIDGVPPGHQPAPTDCQTAVARRPANARVIFGGEEDGRRSNRDECAITSAQQGTVLGIPIPSRRPDDEATRRCEDRRRDNDRDRTDRDRDRDRSERDRIERDDDRDDRDKQKPKKKSGKNGKGKDKRGGR